MKLWISHKNYLPCYLLFCLFFSLVLFLITLLGFSILNRESSKSAVEIPAESASFPIVVIDAGHGGEDGGAVGENGVYEKDLNLSIAKTLDEMLRACGVKTVMTRTEDVLLYDRNSNYQGQKKVQDLATRRAIAERYESAIFISIHMNSFPQTQYNGLQVYYSTNNPTSAQLAEQIQSLVKDSLLPENRRAIKPAGSNIYLLNRLNCSAVLIECGFLSNPEECAHLSDENYRRRLAQTLCVAIMNYLSESGKNPSIGT